MAGSKYPARWGEQVEWKIKYCLGFFSGNNWDGSTNITLERHISNCRQAYINFESDDNKIDYQLSNELAKVQNLINSAYDCQNLKVCAAISDISNVGCGMSTDFEKSSAFLLPTDSVAKQSNKRKMLLSLRLQGPIVVLAPVGSASVGT